MSSFTISTIRSVYLQNGPYDYPGSPYLTKIGTGQALGTYGGDVGFEETLDTGWHVIPNILWGHFCSPKAFHEMVIKYQALHVDGVTCTLYNMIPIQSTLAIQGTTTFSAFNNTVYALGYTDGQYETPPFNWGMKGLTDWYQADSQVFNPVFKEGRYIKTIDCKWGNIPKGDSQQTPGVDPSKLPDVFKVPWWKKPRTGPTTKTQKTWSRQILPIYSWSSSYNYDYGVDQKGYHSSALLDLYDDFSGVYWDPMNKPGDLLELRPGKNAIQFHWSTAPEDAHIWFNLDNRALLYPYQRDSKTHNKWGPKANIFKPGVVHPTHNKRFMAQQKYLNVSGNADSGQLFAHEYTDQSETMMDWRKIPIVPTGWFNKEIAESHIMSQMPYFIYGKHQTEGENLTNRAFKIAQKNHNTSCPGTEYEQAKYPPTQFFTKTIPLFDDKDGLIRVEAQVFMLLQLHLTGKPRGGSAIYAPTWGPFTPVNLYTASAASNFYLSDVRGRSGGARRTFVDTSRPPYTADTMPIANTGELDGEVPVTGVRYDSFASGYWRTTNDSNPDKTGSFIPTVELTTGDALDTLDYDSELPSDSRMQ